MKKVGEVSAANSDLQRSVIKDLEQQLNQIQMEHDNLEKKLAAVKSKNEVLHSANKKLQKEVRETNEYWMDMAAKEKTENKHYSLQVKQLQADVNKLKKDVAKWQQDFKVKENQYIKYRKETDKLHQLVNKVAAF